jgi:uncharacterized membrane protein YhhN
MKWACVLGGAFFIAWSDAHTDEIPVVLGFALVVSAVLGIAFPRLPWVTGFLIGIQPFFVEMLAHLLIVHTPYKPSAGIPWPALLGLIPAMGGVFFGSAIRNLNR